MERRAHEGRVLELVEGDVTEQTTDVIVNAANAALQLGSGVAGAIRRKGGPAIQAECDAIGGTFVGGAAITTGGDLKAKYVIHAVGPRWGEGDEDEKLASAVRNSLALAEEKGLTSISFPAISTGIFGFPVERAASIMLRTAREHIEGGGGLEKVVFVLFGADDYGVFRNALDEVWPGRGNESGRGTG
ncbi:macro domain-containing protein [Thermodesulfobacteriota bacterium]